MNPVSFFKCLADETRLHCVLLLQHTGELCVCDLVDAIAESQPKVSRHLAQLRECELLVARRQGQWMYYRLNPQLPTWAASVIEQAAEGNRAYLKDALARLGEVRCCD
ncbi:metalloregulator ArsR/SmtB family transcription factor [Gilvimarinus sp. DA14]|uniref:metalloregulator ArsR/SmtB family transcription factor n=1 Tax=Gilvimarinus sp. DA14 TaxID=2956798 RepID=UPI0020B77358|nr:metalloregulator ArsR/SmtB family transcription factor [Gilvimarinus sp. DA14]UTF58749.1 metalloregulator ArsR/SmtB family transcription factor [Gilvimarinus sp. DA14]